MYNVCCVTCDGTHKALAKRGTDAALARWWGAGLLLSAQDVTWVSPKLRWLDKLSIAVLGGKKDRLREMDNGKGK